MATINRLEDIAAWQKSRELNQLIYGFSKTQHFSNDYALKNQILRSAGSVMDNIAEGFERSSKLEFINFLSIAKGSAGEVKSQLYRVVDREYISTDEFENAYRLVNDIGKMIMGLIEYLNKTEIKGKKFEGRV